MQSKNKDIAVITVKLLVICALVALIVAFVNFITKDRIAYNQKVSTAEALTDIFKDDFDGHGFSVAGDEFVIADGDTVIAKCAVADCELNDDVTALYIIENQSGEALYYAVSIAPMGFKAEINMLVAINGDLTVKGVKIVSMSETSGIGTKAQDESFLSKFIGKNEAQAKGIDVISGATKTSKPVIDAVSNACNQVFVYKTTTGGDK